MSITRNPMPAITSLALLLLILCSPCYGQPFAKTLADTSSSTGNQNWSGGFGLGGIRGEVETIAVSGDHVFVGGKITAAAGLPVKNVAYWDGNTWHQMGNRDENGVDGDVRSIVVDGDNVYVGGKFNKAGGKQFSNIAVWNRATHTWSGLGKGVGNVKRGEVMAMAMHNGNLYVGGDFLYVGTTVAAFIARWNGATWERVGGGVNNIVTAITPNGNDIVVGGFFTITGDERNSGVASYSPTTDSWEGFGLQFTGDGITSPGVYSIAVDATMIYAGGVFQRINGVRVNSVFRINQATRTWSPMGSGLLKSGEFAYLPATVRSMAISNGKLYAAGIIDLVNDEGASALAKWDGNSWNTIPYNSDFPNSGGAIVTPEFHYAGRGNINAIGVGDNEELYLGGQFDVAGAFTFNIFGGTIELSPASVITPNICRVEHDTVWTALGNTLDGVIRSIATDPEGNIFVGGDFTVAGNTPSRHIVQWDNSSRKWESMGTGANGAVRAVAVSGNSVYIGGAFSEVGGVSANNVARWNMGSRNWSSLSTPPVQNIYAIATAGTDILVGGDNGLARWNGTSWNMEGNVNGEVRAIVVSGNTVYIGGRFTEAGAVSAANVAGWNRNNNTWFPLGFGTDNTVYALAVQQGENGENIYAGGAFSEAGNYPVHNIAMYDTEENLWLPLREGTSGPVYTLATGTDGSLYVGGMFATADELNVSSTAAWRDGNWCKLGTGVQQFTGTGSVYALAAVSDGVYAGGDFMYAGAKSSQFLAKWLYSFTTSSAPLVAQFHNAALQQNFPNPFTNRTTFRFTLANPDNIRLDVYDANGRLVATVAERIFEAGTHTIPWEVEGLESGTYIYTLHGASGIESGKLALIR